MVTHPSVENIPSSHQSQRGYRTIGCRAIPKNGFDSKSEATQECYERILLYLEGRSQDKLSLGRGTVNSTAHSVAQLGRDVTVTADPLWAESAHHEQTQSLTFFSEAAKVRRPMRS